MPLITPESVAEIREQSDIIEIISETTILKKAGKEYKGLCPFHDDKNPSLSVSADKKLYHCFSCGAKGDVFKFVEETQSKNFQEACEYLADKAGVTIEYAQSEGSNHYREQQNDRKKLYEILTAATSFYQQQLSSPTGSKALQYLSDRKVSLDSIKNFSLGYAPEGWTSVYDYLIKQKNFPPNLVVLSGLIVPRESGGYYDRFRDRIIYPIHDIQGRVVAFGGRTICEDERKYINSPESPIFSKSSSWYGIHKAKEAIRKEDSVIIVEGYMDVISLHSRGIANVVASQGTAINPARIKSILQYTKSKTIILNLDGDVAGTQAITRVVKDFEALAYNGDINLKVLQLPGSKDADSYLVNNPPEAYKRLVDNSELWITWELINVVNSFPINNTESELKMIEKVGSLLSKITKSHQLEVYLKKSVEMLCKGDNSKFDYIKDALRAVINDKWSYNKRDETPPLLLRGNKAPVNLVKTKSRSSNNKNLKLPITEETSLHKAEESLIKIYIHYHDCREIIEACIDSSSLVFTRYSKTWRNIQQLIQTKGSDIDIKSYIKDVVFSEDSDIIGLINECPLCSDEDCINRINHAIQIMVISKLINKKNLIADKISKGTYNNQSECDRLHEHFIKVSTELREEIAEFKNIYK